MMDEPIPCTKCNEIPNDILMMNCGHNLCVACAAERMISQNISSFSANKFFLQCEKCKARTDLDQESVTELKKISGNKNNFKKTESRLADDKQGKRPQTPFNTPKIPANYNFEKKVQKQGLNENETECEAHPDEPVMYFCFTCKQHCFCAECVLSGKHNEHDVKIIKKAYAVIKGDVTNLINGSKDHIKQLLQKRKEIADEINSYRSKADNLKKNIEKAFNEIREVVRLKQLEFMKLVDQRFKKMLEVNNGIEKKKIQAEISRQQAFLKKMETSMKKGQVTVLNMYSSEWDSIVELSKSKQIDLNTSRYILDGSLISYINTLKNQLQKLTIPDIYQ